MAGKTTRCLSRLTNKVIGLVRVPGLCAGFKLTTMQPQENKQLRLLVQRITQLGQMVLDESHEGGRDPFMVEQLDSITSEVQMIYDQLQRVAFVGSSRLKRALRNHVVKKDLKRCENNIDFCFKRFEIYLLKANRASMEREMKSFFTLQADVQRRSAFLTNSHTSTVAAQTEPDNSSSAAMLCNDLTAIQADPSPPVPEIITHIRATADFGATSPDCISFKEGDVIAVIDSRERLWWKGQFKDRIGYFPVRCVDPAVATLYDEFHLPSDAEQEMPIAYQDLFRSSSHTSMAASTLSTTSDPALTPKLVEKVVVPDSTNVKGKAKASQPSPLSADDNTTKVGIEAPCSGTRLAGERLAGIDVSSLGDKFEDRSSDVACGIQQSVATETRSNDAPSKSASFIDKATCLEDLDLTGKVIKTSSHAVEYGGYADVWQGEYEGRLVAIKAPRLVNVTAKKLAKRLQREYLAWATTRHKNILRLLGYCTNFGPVPWFVSPWMEHGTAVAYLEANPDASVSKLLTGLADGLSYLHRIPIVHKDIRGSNILVSADGDACISDFGLSYHIGAITAPSGLLSSLRWNAPELHYPEVFGLDDCDVHQPASDVWSFGMTVLELISHNFPFHEISQDPLVSLAILRRKIPEQPACWPKDELHQGFWDICLQCWAFHPVLRLSMEQISIALQTILQHPSPLSFPVFI